MATMSAGFPSRADPFYVVSREVGTVRSDLPLWASMENDPFHLESESSDTCSSERIVERREVEGVPGAFQLLNILTKEEAQRIGELVWEILSIDCSG